MRRSKNFIQHVKVDAESFHVVFHRRKSEVNEVDGFPIDEDVVAGQVAVGGGHTMEPTNRLTDANEHRLGILDGGGLVVQHLDQWPSTEVLDDELTAS